MHFKIQARVLLEKDFYFYTRKFSNYPIGNGETINYTKLHRVIKNRQNPNYLQDIVDYLPSTVFSLSLSIIVLF